MCTKWNLQVAVKELEELFADKEKLVLARQTAQDFVKKHSVDESWDLAMAVWQSAAFQVQEVAVFICGYIAVEHPLALSFLRDTVTGHPDWRIQEVLAMAFDNFCKAKGYSEALPVIDEWMHSTNDKQRRAVTEGLRIGTSRPYFKDNPQIAVDLLSALKLDESEYVRKSVGNALRDISKKHPELIRQEVSNWNLTDRKIRQVYRLATKFIDRTK